MELTEPLDLRGGNPCWLDGHDTSGSDRLPERVDVAIIGAGIMGASLAERLSRDGRGVALIDRRPPAAGSTTASTALVLWASDVPLVRLARDIGIVPASRMWQRVHRAVSDLHQSIADLGLDCRWRSRPELYLAGDLLDADGLAREAALRASHGLPSRWLGAEAVAERFGLPARVAILSGDGFGVDPAALTHGLLRVARGRGATLSRQDIVALDARPHEIAICSRDGSRLSAQHLILATGYEAPRRYLPAAFSLGSSYAIATRPGAAPVWREHAMVWEAADPYLYARETADNRIIIGGEDEHVVAASERDLLLPAKRAQLEARASEMLGTDVSAECVWSATFGTSPDGMPAIGPAGDDDRIWLAYGFGGNGISFARLGADLIAAALAGQPEPDMALFDPRRFGS